MIPPKRHNTWFVACLLCGSVVLLFGMAEAAGGSDQLLHWFIIPVLLCGILAAEDAVKWFKGDLDVFDPVGILGLFGVHFFFLAPLLHVSWGYWMDEVVPPADWRPWLGGMAALNLAGLLAYRATRGHVGSADATSSSGSRAWRLRPRRFRSCLAGALLLAGALQLWVYARFGGVAGYVSAVEHQEDAFLGSSRIAMVTGTFPVLAMMGYAVYLRWRRRTPSWPTLLLVIVGFGALALLFGGLGGLRTKTIYGMFWAIGIVHFCIRPVPRKVIVGGIAAFIPFMYVYGFYKSAGPEGLARAFASSQSRAKLESEIRRPIQSTILGDLGRSDVQAFVLRRVTEPESDYRLACGRTYVAGTLTLIPGPLWRHRPPTKVREGTEALYGRGTYRERPVSSHRDKNKYVGMTSRVFGLAGEAMLNFGPLAIPAAFAALGLVVGCIRRWMMTWDRRDSRRLILPFLVVFCLGMLINDSDVLVSALQEYALFPFLVVAVGSNRLRSARAAAASRDPAGNTLAAFTES
jgi:hypothetical protein